MLDTTIRRVRTLQPDVSDEYFGDDLQPVTDQQVLNDLRLAITCWEPPRDQFSAFFLDEFTFRNVARQIVIAALVKTQKVRCKIVHEEIPYDGSKLFDKPLPRNLQELSEAKTKLTFPSVPIRERKQLQAAEFISVCGICSGSGGLECPKCSGMGTKTCKSCDGVGLETCVACKGTGEVMESATTTRSCRICSGEGTNACRQCDGTGAVQCDADGCSDGSLPCLNCDSTGKIRKITILVTETFVKVGHHLHCKDGWIDSTSELATDLMVLRSQAVAAAGGDVKVEMLRSVLPENIRSHAIRISRDLAEDGTLCSWDLGTCYELRAGYVYHVVAEHLNQKCELIVSGCSNAVTILKAPEQPKSLFKKLGRGIGSLLSGNQVRNSAHVDAVRAGEAFLSDLKLIGPALRELGLEVSLNPDGYDVNLPNRPEGMDCPKLTFNSDPAGNIILHCSILLGDADRDCFPKALMLCNKLPVGQIALQEVNGGSNERFVLVNRQPYATTSPPHLAHLLRLMLFTAYQIRKSNLVGMSL
jgi:hypothetical protein